MDQRPLVEKEGQRTRRTRTDPARGEVLRLILGQGLRLVLVGVAAGIAVSVIVGQMLSKLLFGVRGTDPVSYAGACLALVAVALLGCYVPARGAARLDPQVALREA